MNLLGHDTLDRLMRDHNYFADDGLLTALRLAITLERPLLLEGEPGVGKTEVAYVLAAALGRDSIRLQCYEGIDASQTLYEWNYAKQLLSVRLGEAHGTVPDDLYAEEYLLERPLLRALNSEAGAVLLIDEVDRADGEFEAFLLEFLDRYQITIPEFGTVSATVKPLVVLTSNRTRELHDALKRRCLYHWIPFPDAERERAIIEAQAPGLSTQSAAQLVRAVNVVRSLNPTKRPGIAESIAWAQGAQVIANEGAGWAESLRASLGLLVKSEDDMVLVGIHQQQVFLDDNA